jgi:carbonic anhydrase/acetyltransferase-like protein (isoleucine patch superfamily)
MLPIIHLPNTTIPPNTTTKMATLKPPTNTHRSSSSSHSSGPPKAPLKADPTATIADTAVFQGKHPVIIGAGTIIHPRARFYTYEGPITIGDSCIISEKAVIGAPPPPKPSSSSRSASPSRSSNPSTSPTTDPAEPRKETSTRISYFVTVGPSATIEPGANVHSSATIETLAVVRRGADIGAHSKVCSRCEIAAGGSVGEWVVVYGQGPGMRRKRARGAKAMSAAVVGAAQVAQTAVPGSAPAGKVIEDARLMGLQMEREMLGRLLVPAAGGRKK